MPRKLTLDLEHLSVDSFDTTTPRKTRGTVFGEQCTCYTQCTCPGCPTCAGYQTCGDSCADTCAQTCVQTCDDATCAAWCTDTDYGCGPGDSCMQTDCGPYFCCV
jgi:hypothetical protein